MKFQQGSAFLLYNHCVNKKDEARAATWVSAPTEVSGSGAVGDLKPNRDAIVTGWSSLGMVKPGEPESPHRFKVEDATTCDCN